VTPAPLAREIHTLRTQAGLTLDALAERARISRSTLVKIESGSTPDPGFSVVARIFAAAGAGREDILKAHVLAIEPWRPRVIGVGYEGLGPEELLEKLTEQRVQVVADIRLNPISRKRGLSKTALRERLEQAEITYMHLPALGNPKENRPGYADPNAVAPRAAFAERLRAAPAKRDLATLQDLSSRRVVALLCFEREQAYCHRAEVLAALG
jgi:transcriptional regulator with XRE-family HTH domain